MSDLSAVDCACGSCASCAGNAPAPAVADPVRFRQSAIRQRMLDGIASVRVEASAPLAGLTVRTDDDPAIALIDAYSSSLHVLAWNTARLADDGSILKTEDRDALVNLTRLLGYEPRPAISASTMLAFTVNQLEGGPTTARVAKGTKVASVPVQDEKPQIFETDIEIEARAEWNALNAVSARTGINGATTAIYAKGTDSSAKIGDIIAVQYEPQTVAMPFWLLGRITAVARITDLEGRIPQHTRFDLTETRPVLGSTAISANRTGRIYVLAQKAAPFGANAPDIKMMTDAVRTAFGAPNGAALPVAWNNFEIGAPGTTDNATVDLDSTYQNAIVGNLALFIPTDASAPPTGVASKDQLGAITKSVERSRVDFSLSAKVSRVTVEAINLEPKNSNNVIPAGSMRYALRETAAYLQTETLETFYPEIDGSLPAVADRLTIKGAAQLPVGRRIILSGQQWMAAAGVAGPDIAESATILSATVSGNTTELIFEAPITNRFRSTTLRVLGNCAPATHGETQNAGASLGGGEGELLGSGHAAKRNQKFALKAKPLAYVPAANPRGFAPAIEVRVDGRTYKNVETLHGIDPSERAYTVQTVQDDVSEIQMAGRLPTGINNVSALYRTGGGVSGNMDAGRITMAMAPVLGITGISNPIPAEGASDAETLDDMRKAAPQSIRTLDRVVSLSDFEAFARGYRGIGKALATELRSGMRSIVCLTIANTDLQSPAPGASLFEDLRQALKTYAVPGRHVRIEGFDRLDPEITAALAVDESLFRRKDVEAAARDALAQAFSPAKRGFATALHRSEVISVLQQVPGVTAVSITRFVLRSGPPPDADRLLCPAPKMEGSVFTRGGLLAVNPDYLTFTEMQP
jgi:predicted phage baseplate assembly protein